MFYKLSWGGSIGIWWWFSVCWLLFASSCAAGLWRLSNSSFSSFLLRNINSFFSVSFLKRNVTFLSAPSFFSLWLPKLCEGGGGYVHTYHWCLLALNLQDYCVPRTDFFLFVLRIRYLCTVIHILYTNKIWKRKNVTVKPIK